MPLTSRHMSDDRTFMMGKFAAALPGALRYARNHMWCSPVGRDSNPASETGRIDPAPETVALRLHVLRRPSDAGRLLSRLAGQPRRRMSNCCSRSATSKRRRPSPICSRRGRALSTAFNPALLEDPSGINVDNYGAGWLFDMDCDGETLMNVDEYCQFLDENWERTQVLIKGKINTRRMMNDE